MGAQELMALSLILSIGASGAGWMGCVLIERVSDDPRLRDAVWGGALGLGLLPVLAVGVLLLTPAPVREVAAAASPLAVIETAPDAAFVAVPDGPAQPDAGLLAWIALGGAGAIGLARLVALALRTLRLARMIGRAEPAEAELKARVERIAARLHVAAPPAVVSNASGDALLAGLGRPRLILPACGQPAPDAVIAHELAHLKRGDHRTLWLEETLAVLLAFNPLIPRLRARRDAAREEACDALALTGAETEARRAYAQTLIQALRDRAGSQGLSGPRVALTFTGAGRTTAMHRLKAVMTPAAPAGRRPQLIAAALGLAVTIAAGEATVALAGQRAVEVRMAAATAATRSALAALPAEARERFRRASAADYQIFCASADAADEGFCAGVLFSHLARAPGNGLCLPEAGGDDMRLGRIVTRGKAEIARLAPRRDEGAYEYSERALKAAYPCGSAASAGLPAGPTLTVRIGQSREPFILGSRYVLRVALRSQDGEITRLEFPIVPDQPLERDVLFRLEEEQLPTLTRGRTYDLTAEIGDVEGRVFYAAEPVTVRMAPGSRGRLAALRPELVLARTATASPPSAATRTYQARLIIREAGQVVAAGRMRVLPDGSTTTTLSADGREYQFDLLLEGPDNDPESRGRLTARADVARTASAGGWETVARPVLLFQPNRQAQMQWGDEAGLSFDILIEPA